MSIIGITVDKTVKFNIRSLSKCFEDEVAIINLQ